MNRPELVPIAFRTTVHNQDVIDLMCRDTDLSISDLILNALKCYQDSTEYEILKDINERSKR